MKPWLIPPHEPPAPRSHCRSCELGASDYLCPICESYEAEIATLRRNYEAYRRRRQAEITLRAWSTSPPIP